MFTMLSIKIKIDDQLEKNQRMGSKYCKKITWLIYKIFLYDLKKYNKNYFYFTYSLIQAYLHSTDEHHPNMVQNIT